MRKYFTWRCICLHVLVLILVPTFFLLGRWQYHAALSGNSLSWAYTFEWPLFGIYAAYMWWKLIHDQSTAFDKLWNAKQRSAAASSGVPIEEIPGWALDKTLSRAATEAQASLGSASAPRLSDGGQAKALESHDRKLAYAQFMDSKVAEGGSLDGIHQDAAPDDAALSDALPDDAAPDDAALVVDARVINVTVEVDEDLLEYNRYLAELNRSGPPKRW